MNNKELAKYQDETINTLEEMKDELYAKISSLQDEIDTINGVIAKFQAQLLTKDLFEKLGNLRQTND